MNVHFFGGFRQGHNALAGGIGYWVLLSQQLSPKLVAFFKLPDPPPAATGDQLGDKLCLFHFFFGALVLHCFSQSPQKLSKSVSFDLFFL